MTTMDQSTKIETTTKPGTSPVKFIEETRREIAKVAWPTRKETMMTTVMIVVMATIAGLFFLLIDSILGFAVGRLLGINS